jgi:hypothetical protein
MATRVLLDQCLYIAGIIFAAGFRHLIRKRGQTMSGLAHPVWNFHRMDCSYTGCQRGCKVVMFQIPRAVMLIPQRAVR